MNINEVTVDQFAKWSFERDKNEGLVDSTWESLDNDERESYLEEARYYVNEHPKDDWPVDILERLG